MARKDSVNEDRRGFLTRAGKIGGALVGAAYLPGVPPIQRGGGGPEIAPQFAGDEFPVEEKGIVRVLGVVQRRPGLTRMQVKFRSPDFDFSAADRAMMAGVSAANVETRRPTSIGNYYRWVHAELTKNDPGRNVRHIHNIVSDGAFGDGTTACTPLSNRDLVMELSYERTGEKPATAGRPEPNPPDSLEAGTALNLVVQQVVAQGMRPAEASGNEKIMHFIKLSGAAAAAGAVKAWQTLHAKAAAANAAFVDGLQGHELLQRLPGTPARQTTRCSGEVAVPDLVACFWPKKGDGGTVFQNYERSFRYLDAEKALDAGASFFLVIQEYQYTAGNVGAGD